MHDSREILTVGHSTHPIERFLELLGSADIEVVADVRRYPGSRRHPQFGAEALASSLAEAGIGYEPFGEELGGRRRAQKPRAESRWRNAAFAAYAEYMESEEFAAGLARLERLAHERRAVVMCAEGLWWRCHRRLIADALAGRDWQVLHLFPDAKLQPHPDTLELE